MHREVVINQLYPSSMQTYSACNSAGVKRRRPAAALPAQEKKKKKKKKKKKSEKGGSYIFNLISAKCVPAARLSLRKARVTRHILSSASGHHIDEVVATIHSSAIARRGLRKLMTASWACRERSLAVYRV